LGAAEYPLWAFLGGSAAALLLSACGPGVSIDYVDSVWFNGIEYAAVPERGAPLLTEAALGPAVGKVKQQLSGHVSDRSYKPRDGDAGLLEAGTQLYSEAAFVWPRIVPVASSSTRRTTIQRRNSALTSSMYRAGSSTSGSTAPPME
jgi:hypothetical protein